MSWILSKLTTGAFLFLLKVYLNFDKYMQAGQMESGQVVLVTAAAGGTGQFAVQVSNILFGSLIFRPHMLYQGIFFSPFWDLI